MQQPFNIIFYGTPEFAIPSLEQILNSGYSVKAVVTVPDKPAGRGLEIRRSAVGSFADRCQIPVFMPEDLSDPEFLEIIKKMDPAVQVVVAFRKLPQQVWSLPSVGTINLHASLLPQYRGAAPINWAIINGEQETGVSTFFINDRIDTGDIIMQKKIDITDYDNAGTLHDKLSIAGAKLVQETLAALKSGTYPKVIQDLNVEVKKAPKLSKEICRINWYSNVNDIYNFIRGLAPYPAAWTKFNGMNLKIFSAGRITSEPDSMHGTVITDYKNYLHVTVKDGFISVLELQLEGRKKMNIKEFLMGISKDQLPIIQ